MKALEAAKAAKAAEEAKVAERAARAKEGAAAAGGLGALHGTVHGTSAAKRRNLVHHMHGADHAIFGLIAGLS